MFFSLSTRWNATRHSSGEEMIEEILELGFNHVELGYDLSVTLVPGVQKMIDSGAVQVNSVHAYCPVPRTVTYGHPELYSMTSRIPRVRAAAVSHLTDTIEYAAHVGASTVVVHGGNVEMRNLTHKLIHLHEKGEQFSRRYEKTKTKLIIRRDKKVQKHLDNLRGCLEDLLPVLEDCKVKLALENLPTWEAIPSEAEILKLTNELDSPWLGYWHDIGHGQVRQTLGFVGLGPWLDKLRHRICGMHVHDVADTASDHIMPPAGEVDFSLFNRLTDLDIPAVLEPYPGLPAEDITTARKHLSEIWKISE